MKKVQTGDGTITLYNGKYKELYHAMDGAVREARKKYAESCKIAELARKKKGKPLRVLDLCFGIGYNAIAAIDAAAHNPIEVVSLEKDRAVLKDIDSLNPPLQQYSLARSVAKRCSLGKARQASARSASAKLSLRMGDARQLISKVPGQFDAVFLDPFSVPKNPELWSKHFFEKIAEKMTDKAILATYSCAQIVRAGLVNAGFSIANGPEVIKNRPSTIASKSPLDEELTNKYRVQHYISDPELKASNKELKKELW